MRSPRVRFLAVITMAVFLMSMVGPASIGAQDATPTAGIGDEVVFERLYPVAIHQGTCTEEIGDVVFDLGFTDLVGSEDDTSLGVVGGPDVMMLDTTIDTTFDDLFASTHAVVVHGPDNFDEIIACADFGGFVEGGRSAATLASVNDSGIVGAVILDEDEGDIFGLLDDQVKVTVYLIMVQAIERDSA
ncbi:MAG: hypothetical protein AB7V46_06070 [Thermomicrobiales bacterium]